MKNWLFCIGLLLPALALADTTWVAPGDVSGIWTAEHSPYMIQGDLRILSGDSLWIGPGVACDFTGSYRVNVEGEFMALGALADSIVFTRPDADLTQGWAGIWFHQSASVQFDYCVIEYMLDTGWCPFYLRDSTAVSIAHTTFRFNGYRTMMLDWAAHVDLQHCVFTHNGEANSHLDGGALYLHSRATAQVSDCIFADNTSGQNVAGALKVNGGAEAHLERCVFRNNRSWSGGAIWAYSPTITLDRCTFFDNSDPGGSQIRIQTDYDTSYCHITINSCIFANSRGGGALALSEAPRPDIRYCLFNGNNPLFREGGGQVGFAEIVAENLNGTPCDRYGNIFVDPLFADTANVTLPLQAGSPCIDAGDPRLVWDADDTPPEIGAHSLLHPQTWTTIYFPGGFAELGCPCTYPFQLLEGSVVCLRRDLTHDGPTGDDSVAASFAIAAGAGLPPWDGHWRPQPELSLTGGSFYVQITTPSCRWLSGYLRMAGVDTLVVPRDAWACTDGEAEYGCFSTAPSLLDPLTKQAGLPAARTPVSLRATPNPFNATTELHFALESAAHVELVIFDVAGRRVATLANADYDSGRHTVRFDGTTLATGIYFAALRTGSALAVRKLLLLK